IAVAVGAALAIAVAIAIAIAVAIAVAVAIAIAVAIARRSVTAARGGKNADATQCGCANRHHFFIGHARADTVDGFFDGLRIAINTAERAILIEKTAHFAIRSFDEEVGDNDVLAVDQPDNEIVALPHEFLYLVLPGCDPEVSGLVSV